MTSTTKQKKQLKVAEASASYLVEPQEVRHSSESRNPAALPVGWHWALLGDVVESMKNGIYKPASSYAENGLACLRMYNIGAGQIVWRDIKRMRLSEAEIREYELLPGDLLVNRVNSRELVGKTAVIPDGLERCVFESKNIRVRLRRDLAEPKFVSYRLLAEGTRYFTQNAQQVVGMASISQPQVARFPLPLAPLDEQRRIVAEIETQFTRLEAGIAALRRVQANLKRYRAAVLKAACEGRLVPTEDELARKEGRAYESADQLLARILAERREKWAGRGKYKEPVVPDAKNLPPFPEGWVVASVDQCSSHITSGSRDWSQFYGRGTGTFILAQNIRPMRLDLSEPQTVDAPIGDAETERTRVALNDILITIVGAKTGDVCRVPAELREHFVCQSVALLRPTFGSLAKFAELYLASPENGQAFWKRYIYGQGRPHLSFEQLRMTAIPLPPLAEQVRIVAEVEQRLSVVEEQEAVVTATLQRATRLRQAILQRAFTGQLVDYESTNSIKLNAQTALAKRPNRHFARALLSAEIVHQLHTEPTFGRVKHQKIFHLCEHIAQITGIEGEYHREAAGPLDNKLIYANETELKKQDWYATVKRSSYGHAYQPLKKAGTHLRYMERYWPHKIGAIRKLIELMRGWDTDRCEIFSTTYAAWNDLLLWGHEATEETIVHEILNRWHDSKRRISEKRWRSAIAWIKKEGFAPTGFGKSTCSPENA